MDRNRRNWERPLKKHQPLQLVAVWDALTAKLIEQAGFPAYQVGGFALDGMRFGFPDMDVNRLGQKSNAVRDRGTRVPLAGRAQSRSIPRMSPSPLCFREFSRNSSAQVFVFHG
jgi:hypothetical protein